MPRCNFNAAQRATWLRLAWEHGATTSTVLTQLANTTEDSAIPANGAPPPPPRPSTSLLLAAGKTTPTSLLEDTRRTEALAFQILPAEAAISNNEPTTVNPQPTTSCKTPEAQLDPSSTLAAADEAQPDASGVLAAVEDARHAPSGALPAAGSTPLAAGSAQEAARQLSAGQAAPLEHGAASGAPPRPAAPTRPHLPRMVALQLLLPPQECIARVRARVGHPTLGPHNAAEVVRKFASELQVTGRGHAG